jgi:hypothetical protein
MEFQEHHGSVLTLGMLRGRPGVAVRFACGKCRKEVIVPPAAAIAKLSTEGGRGEDTPIDELGGLAKAACTCGAMSWKVEILWHDPNKVPEWVRRALDRREGAPAGK